MVEEKPEEKGPHFDTKILYLLQVTKSKLNSEDMFLLKALLTYILNTTGTQHLLVEVYFEQDLEPIEDHMSLVLKMLTNAYNLLEPEQSKSFPLVSIDYLFPQIFKAQSVLLTDHYISQVYHNPETNPDRAHSIIA